jgi:hypothetical protein
MARFSGGSGIGGGRRRGARGGGCGTEGSHEIGFGDADGADAKFVGIHAAEVADARGEGVDDEAGGFGELAREFLERFDDEGEDGAVVDAGEVAVCIVGGGVGIAPAE